MLLQKCYREFWTIPGESLGQCLTMPPREQGDGKLCCPELVRIGPPNHINVVKTGYILRYLNEDQTQKQVGYCNTAIKLNTLWSCSGNLCLCNVRYFMDSTYKEVHDNVLILR